MRTFALALVLLVGCGPSVQRCGIGGTCPNGKVCTTGLCQPIAGGSGGGGGTTFSENLYLCEYTIRCSGVSATTGSDLVCAANSTAASSGASTCDTSKCPCSKGGCSKYQDGC